MKVQMQLQSDVDDSCEIIESKYELLRNVVDENSVIDIADSDDDENAEQDQINHMQLAANVSTNEDHMNGKESYAVNKCKIDVDGPVKMELKFESKPGEFIDDVEMTTFQACNAVISSGQVHTNNVSDRSANGARPLQLGPIKRAVKLSNNSKSKMKNESNAKKKFKCDHCKYSSNYMTSLVPHLRTHTGEKPYSCVDCGKRFTQLSNLRRHQMVHTGERPFQCKLCLKRFGQKLHLKHHLNFVHRKESD